MMAAIITTTMMTSHFVIFPIFSPYFLGNPALSFFADKLSHR